jgi:hypothetical protein
MAAASGEGAAGATEAVAGDTLAPGAELCGAALENTVPVAMAGNCICDAVDAGRLAD